EHAAAALLIGDRHLVVADVYAGDLGAEMHEPLDGSDLAGERLAREALHEHIHAARRLEQRGLPGIVAVAEDPVVPDVGAQDLLELERAQRLAVLAGGAGRDLIAGPPLGVLINIGIADFGEVAEPRQHGLQLPEVLFAERQVEPRLVGAFDEPLGQVALQVVERAAHLVGAAVADAARMHEVGAAREDVGLQLDAELAAIVDDAYVVVRDAAGPGVEVEALVERADLRLVAEFAKRVAAPPREGAPADSA